MACRGLLSACLAGAATAFGCSALLDLDVQYAASADAGSMAKTTDALAEADGASPEAASGEGASDAETSLDIPDGSSPDVSSDSSPDVPEAAPPAHPIQYVQSVSASNNYMGAIVTLTFASPVTLNDTIVVAADGTITAVDVSDSLGNQFSSTTSVPNGNYGAFIYYASVVTSGMDMINVTLPGNPSGLVLDAYAFEYSGVGTLDGVTGQNGTSPDMHSGFVTTTAPGDLIFGYGIVTTMGLADAGTGFMARERVHDNLTEDELFPGVGRVEATATMITGNAWTMMVAAFKAR
jgi:hypothetical protein